jgi:hypothetical protein
LQRDAGTDRRGPPSWSPPPRGHEHRAHPHARVLLILEQTQSPPVSAAPINPVIMTIRFSSHMARSPFVSQLAGVVRPVRRDGSYRAGRWSVIGREVETRGGAHQSGIRLISSFRS